MIITDLFESYQTCPECGGPAFTDLILAEKKDACYYKVKASAKVWPSAYASGRLVQCRKKGAANYGNKSKTESLAEFAPGGGDSGDYLRALASAWYNGVFNTGSLPKGIKTQEDVERLLNRGIVCPDGKTRKLHIDYNSDFDGVVIYSDDYYEHGDESGELDSRTGQPFGPYDHMEFAGDELDEGLNEVDRRGFLKGLGAAAVGAGAGYVGGVRKVQNTTLARVLGKLNGFLKPLKASRVKDKWSYELIARTQDLIQKYKIDADIYNDDLYSFGENQGERAYSMAFRNGIQTEQDREKYEAMLFELSADLMNATSFHGKYINKESVNQGVAEGKLDEKWSAKYKRSINCSHPKGFSQRAHCAGKKKHNESVEMEMTCPDCGMCETHQDHTNLDEACWKGYHKEGNKKLFGKTVPNCVKNTNEEESMTENQDELARILELGGVKLDEELVKEFDLIESIIESIAERNGVDAEAVWTDLESLSEDELYVFAVTSEPIMEDWQKANKKDRTDGMSQKAVNAYRREHPGSKLKTAVTTKPSKLKKGSKASKRRKSYCSRSRGQMKMHNISCSKTPDKAICKARRRWNC